jgi:hypothetical protein
VIALRNVLKKAANNDGHLSALPMTGLKPLKVRTVKRPLLTQRNLKNSALPRGYAEEW